MYHLSPRDQIITEMKEIPANYRSMIILPPDHIVKKIQRISTILEKNNDLIRDSELIGRILKFTEKCDNSENKNIISVITNLILRHCCNKSDGVVKITEYDPDIHVEIASAIQESSEYLGRLYVKNGKFDITQDGLSIFMNQTCENSPEKFWNFVKENGVKALEIHLKNGESVCYGEILLKQMAYNNFSIKDLTEIYTLDFDTGEQFPLPKAKLLLSGDFFKAMLKHGYKETESYLIPMKGIPINVFCDVLNKVETGKDPEKTSEEYYMASQFLQFNNLPEGVYGGDDWIQTYGDPGKVPLPSKKFIDFWNTYCNTKTHLAVYIPATLDGDKPVTLNEMAERASKSKTGNNTKLIGAEIETFFKIPISVRNASIKEGYWLILEKFPVKIGEREESHEAYCDKDSELPTILEVVICNLMLFAQTGEFLFGRNPWRSVTCQKYERWYTSVGGFGLSGLFMRIDSMRCQGVVRSWKFPVADL